MTTLQEILFAAAFPACQVFGLVALGLIFRVDRKPRGGDRC